MSSSSYLIAYWPFASGWLLFWSLSAAIPILLHLWYRRHRRQVPWAAMQFLQAAWQREARRLRLRQWLLLLVRTLLLLCLAIAMAEPFLRMENGQAVSPDRPARTLRILVLDVSYSMSYREDAGSRLDRAKELASQVVRNGNAGDAFLLFAMGDEPQAVISMPSFDGAEVMREIEGLQIRPSKASLTAMLALLSNSVAQPPESRYEFERTEIQFFSDLDRNGWEAAQQDVARRLLQELAARASLSLFNIGTESPDNAAVTEVVVSPSNVLRGERAEIQIEFQNFGSRPIANRVARVFVNGVAVDELQVSVGPGQTVQLPSYQMFDEIGDQEVRVDWGSDRLELDDQRWAIASVQEGLDVLCVDAAAGAARNLALALNPTGGLNARIRSRLALESELMQRDFSQFDCIFWCHPQRFRPNQLDAMRRYVASGGRIVLVLGPELDRERFNEDWAELGVELQAAAEAGSYTFDPRGYEHPIVRPFRGNERSGLLTTPIWRYWKLRGSETLSTGDAPDWQVVLDYDTGDPALVLISAGRGWYGLLTTGIRSQPAPGTEAWSAISTWPSFVPLMQEIALELATRQHEVKSLQIGDTLQATAAGDEASIVIRTPAQRVHEAATVTQDGQATWTFHQWDRVGIYVATGKAADRRFAANLDVAESRLETLALADLPEEIVSGSLGESEASNPSTGSWQRPLFRWFLLATLALLIADASLSAAFSTLQIKPIQE